MSAPAISIVLPAYNCSRYIASTIESLLNQTFGDFELVIINDGSKDDTEAIVRSFTDKRIVYKANSNNCGLVYTLNKGVEVASAGMIARMDADDLAHEQRLEKQYQWLTDHPKTAVVGCTIALIDGEGSSQGTWPLDQRTTTGKAIRKVMPWENCLAHPSVMMRKEVATKYRYNPRQLQTEDYDIWLRMLADGLIIEKVPENLLHYRVHTTSITGSILRKQNPFFKQFHCKRRFLAQQINNKNWGPFEQTVLYTTAYDGAMGVGKSIKQMLKF